MIDAGGKVIEILADPGATRMSLESWIMTHNLNITSVIDAPGMSGAALMAATIRETTFIVQMPEMKIVWLTHGNQTPIGDPGVDAATTQMLQFLKMP